MARARKFEKKGATGGIVISPPHEKPGEGKQGMGRGRALCDRPGAAFRREGGGKLVCAVVSGKLFCGPKVLPTGRHEIAVPPLQAPLEYAYHRRVAYARRYNHAGPCPDGSGRRVWPYLTRERFTRLLVKVKRQTREQENCRNVQVSGDVDDNKFS